MRAAVAACALCRQLPWHSRFVFSGKEHTYMNPDEHRQDDFQRPEDGS